MALTDVGNAYFLQWQSQSGVQGRQVQGIYGLVSRLPNADEVAQRAATENWTPAFLLEYSTKLLQQGAQPMGQPVVVNRTGRMNAARENFFAANPVEQGPQAVEGPQGEPVYQPMQGVQMTRSAQLRADKAAQEAKKSAKKGGLLSFLPFGKKKEEAAPPPVTAGFGAQRVGMPNGAQFGARPGSAASAATAKPAGKKGMSPLLVIVIVLLVLIVSGGAITLISATTGFSGFGGQSVFGPDTTEVAPAPPDANPLNFQSSVESQGFLGQAQKLVFIIGMGILLSMIGDIVYRKQWGDGLTALMGVAFTILVLFPTGTARWIGVVFLFRELYLIWFASFQGGRDFTPMSTYFLLVAIVGGLMLTKIGAVQNIFPDMIVSSVPPMTQIGYFFQVMQFGQLAFPAVVYLTVIIGTLLSTYECIRPSEDKSSRFGSLIAAGIGLGIYFLFAHAFHLQAWIAFLIAILVAVGGSAALRSEPAKQFVAPIWGVRSPFDGGTLLCAILLLLVVIFGQVWWLVPLL